jgi:hypothetical protein
LTLGSLYRARDDVFSVCAVSSIEAEEGRGVKKNSMTSTEFSHGAAALRRTFAPRHNAEAITTGAPAT